MIFDFLLDPINLRRDVRRLSVAQFSRWLEAGHLVYDIGCGAKPFKTPVEALSAVYTGVDIADGFYDPALIDLIGSAYAVPIPDESADALISCQVMEHLERPQDALLEARRILKPGGMMFLSFPFLYPMHAAPRDFFRYTEFGMATLLKEHGFEVSETRRLGGFWYACGLWTGLYLQTFDRGILRKTFVIRAISGLFKWLCLGLHGLEGAALRLLKKDVDALRRDWTVNYVLVVRKV